jgi:hypothetical protein
VRILTILYAPAVYLQCPNEMRDALFPIQKCCIETSSRNRLSLDQGPDGFFCRIKPEPSGQYANRILVGLHEMCAASCGPSERSSYWFAPPLSYPRSSILAGMSNCRTQAVAVEHGGWGTRVKHSGYHDK